MPQPKTVSALQKKYGAKIDAAVAKHADEKTLPADYSGLPPGITNGIAQLDEAYFEAVAPGKKNAGEFYFRASGVVMEPAEHNGVPVRGLHTSYMEMVCDTTGQAGKTTTMDEHIDRIFKTFRALGGEDFTAGRNSAADMEALAADLAALKPFFRFSTAPRKDQTTGEVTGSWERWGGGKGLENWSPGASANGQPFADGTGDAGDGDAGAGDQAADETGTDPDADGSLTSLAEEADGGNEDSARTLSDMAVQAGVPEGDKTDPNSINGAADWAAVVQMIRAAAGFAEEPTAEPEPEPEPEPPVDPAKGEVWRYKPLGADKKPVKKAVEVTVTDVQVKTRTVTCRNNTTKATYKGVSFDKLEPAE